MPGDHHLEVTLAWEGGADGTGRLEVPGLPVGAMVSRPPQLGGPGSGTSPEALLLAAAAACYATTLAEILGRMRLQPIRLAVRSEVEVAAGPPVRLAAIVHRPALRLAAEREAARARRAALLAEEHCAVSRALRGNVLVRVEPEISWD